MIEQCIRLSETEEAFYFSIRSDGVLLDTVRVLVSDVAEPDGCEYYGGSQTMD
jgi:hypothetical protein